MLCVVGIDFTADGLDNMPAHRTLQGYPYNTTTGSLGHAHSHQFSLPEAGNQKTEWGTEYGWWAGPYDLAPISEDRDLHAFDINLRQFTKDGKSVVLSNKVI